LILQKTRTEAGEQAEMKATLTRCLARSFIDSEVDEIEVDLRTGLVMTRTTDLYIPDAIPFAVTRCYRLWDNRSKAFGYNTALSWDMSPIGSRHPYTYINLILCDGRQIYFDRISKGSSYEDALYEHRQTASEFLSARFGWNGNGWDLKKKDGSLFLFPESYHAKRGVDGALVGLSNSAGDSVGIERGKRRNLNKIKLPSGRFISFEYDSGDRITKVDDDQKRTVNYEYDLAGRLVKVQRQMSVSRYSYDGTYLKAIDLDERRLLDLEYRRGRIARLSIRDMRSYRFQYDYDPRDNYTVTRAYVTDPDGLVTKFDITPK
jgi:YD repeat-containing protein